jgi:hypothetical protein
MAGAFAAGLLDTAQPGGRNQKRAAFLRLTG